MWFCWVFTLFISNPEALSFIPLHLLLLVILMFHNYICVCVLFLTQRITSHFVTFWVSLIYPESYSGYPDEFTTHQQWNVPEPWHRLCPPDVVPEQGYLERQIHQQWTSWNGDTPTLPSWCTSWLRTADDLSEQAILRDGSTSSRLPEVVTPTLSSWCSLHLDSRLRMSYLNVELTSVSLPQSCCVKVLSKPAWTPATLVVL